MALIAMAVYDTAENGRAWMTDRTLECLADTVNFARHRIIVVDNGSVSETKDLLRHYERAGVISIITLPENIGTARAVNKAWAYREPGEYVVKMDNDVVIHQKNWADEMEEVMRRMPEIGILGLKRKDLWENPNNPDEKYRSTLHMVQQTAGERWYVVEKVNHVMGTCQMFSPALLDQIGYLYQPGLYGFDDSLAAVRCQVAGFWNCFLPHIEIDHIDPGGTVYQGWKEKKAWADMTEYNRLKDGYISGKLSIFHGLE